MNRLRLIEASDQEWAAWVESTDHDIYQTAGYHRVAETIGHGTPRLLVFGQTGRFVAWPYLLRSITSSTAVLGEPATDVTSTYGYSGPLVVGCEPGDALIDEAWDAFRSTWRDQRAVSVFTRFHPILENHRWFVHTVGEAHPATTGPGVVLTGSTVSIDVTSPDATIVAGYERTFRQEIAQSRRRGLITTLDADWAHLDTFVDLYTETMRRNHASSVYFLGRDYFDKLLDELDGDLMLFVSTVGDDVAAACLFLSHHGILHPHVAGTSTAFLPMSPLKVMWDDVRRWAAERGDRILHLGGGRGAARDSLFDFKARFSPRRHDFYTGRWILDREGYDLLVQDASARQDSESKDFPAYRSRRPLE